MFRPSSHASQRYIERFAGNLSHFAAAACLLRIARNARFRRALPGGARLYATGTINLVVHSGTIITVYRLTYEDIPTPPSDWKPEPDLWAQAA
ncbi:hypothetical protein EHF33_20230 (plasmid) [Deinococcus psychrotolerans]|uniref:Uncharacterized protein n=1 Tax=Deinococcus psychrotolerans TaxID=2489213 RepID=A0A3G8YIZ7_9DEIO|nr:hypothetical protein [Deinococcus psychrotolerans]AZI45239.1 hypothetical protein EHF33_20230 [Deinococcus psychrotolerans]